MDIKRTVWDADLIRYGVGFASEKRHIKVVHKQTGDEIVFKNRTEFYGRGKAKDKGWIGEQNASRTTPISVDDYDIYDIQVPEPIDHALFTAKRMFENVQNALGVKDYIGFYGAGESFRVDRSTIIGYKQNRDSLLKPILIDDITEYIHKKYKFKPVSGLEADDWCIIEGSDPHSVVITHDKDADGCAVFKYNPTKPELGVTNGRGYGGINLVETTSGKAIKGYGRAFFYAQVATGDAVDNYFANSASEKKWGDVSAWNIIGKATNDKESLEALVEIYKTLYPEPKRIIGWKGDEIEIDWLYVLDENFDLARMLRHPTDDIVKVKDVLDKLGVRY